MLSRGNFAYPPFFIPPWDTKQPPGAPHHHHQQSSSNSSSSSEGSAAGGPVSEDNMQQREEMLRRYHALSMMQNVVNSNGNNMGNNHVMENNNIAVAAAAAAAANDPDNKKAPKRKRAKFIRKVTCQVCGDVANDHIHYGAIACYSCRAFFRRGVNSNAPYYCSQDKKCVITKHTRKHCQYCRFQKCLGVGMKSSWVMTEEDKIEKRERALLKKLKLQTQQQQKAAMRAAAQRGINIGQVSRSQTPHTPRPPPPPSVIHPPPPNAMNSTTAHLIQLNHGGPPPMSRIPHQYTPHTPMSPLTPPATLPDQHFPHHHSSPPSPYPHPPHRIQLPPSRSPSPPLPPPPPPPPPLIPVKIKSPPSSSPDPSPNFLHGLSSPLMSPTSPATSDYSEPSTPTSSELILPFTPEENQLVQNVMMTEQEATKMIPLNPEAMMTMIRCAKSGSAVPYSVCLEGYTTCMKRIIRFASQLDFFQDLPQEDQRALLLANTDMIVNIRSARMLRPGINLQKQMTHASGIEDETIKSVDLSTKSPPSNQNDSSNDDENSSESSSKRLEYIQIFQTPWACSYEHEQKFHVLMRRIFDLEMDETTTVLMSMMALFSVSNAGLSDYGRVMNNQEFFSQMLYRYLISKIGRKEAVILLPKYMFLLAQLEEMAQIMVTKRLTF